MGSWPSDMHSSTSDSEKTSRAYYDAFSEAYDDRRGSGYHALIDDQACEIVRRVGQGRDLLEVGCGTGLLLDRARRFAGSRVVGVDLSLGMLARARSRGLCVAQGSATRLPFADASVDVAYSFKVLAHVQDLSAALGEMGRVVRPGGHVVFDLYNRRSLRHLIKRLSGPRATSRKYDEGSVFTRYDTIADVEPCLPPTLRLQTHVGIRMVTPHSLVHRIPGIRRLWGRLEWGLMNSPLARYAGFLVFVLERVP